MDKYEEWLRAKIEQCNLERNRNIRLYGEQSATFINLEVEVEKKIYDHCLKKYRQFKQENNDRKE